VAVHHRRDAADASVAAVEIFPKPADEVVGQRLYFLYLLDRAARGQETRFLPVGNRVHDSHANSIGCATGDLAGAKDGRRVGGIHEVRLPGNEPGQLWRASDTSRVDKTQAGDVAAEIAAEPAGGEVLRIRDEKWPLLL